MKLYLILIFILLGPGSAWALNLDTTRGPQPVVDGWIYRLEATPLANELPPLSVNPGIPIRFGEDVPLPDRGGWFTLELPLNKITQGEGPLYLFMGKYYGAAQIFLNGVLLFTRGKFPPDYFVQIGKPLVVKLPKALLKGDGRDLIQVVSYYEGPRMPLSASFFGGEKEYLFEIGVSEVFNTTLYYIFGIINLFAGLYFLIQFYYRRRYPANLLFALSSIFMGLYFFEIGMGDAFIPGEIFRHLAKASLPLSMTFLVLFYTEYFGIHKNRIFQLIVLGVGLIAGMFLFLSPQETALNERFKVVLIPLLVSFLFSVYMVIRATVSGNRDAIPLMVGSILGVAFGSYDVVYFIIGAEPFAWFQSIGFFAVEMSMFLSLAIRSARLYKNLETSSAELEAKKSELLGLNTSLSRFVPQEFLSFLGKDSITQIQLGDGVLKDMTVLFTDIRNFTTLSESLTPEDNFRLLNSYLSRMAPIIRESGGIIDKYIGDAIMALFPGSPAEALLAALRMRASFKEYNEGRKRAGYDVLETGLGIHFGSLMMGTIGEERRMDSTVISDAVNISSRLESLTKLVGVPILVSGSTLELIPGYNDLFLQRHLGAVKVRGKAKCLAVHELLTESSDPLFALKFSQKKTFETAVKTFEMGDFRGAKKQFKELLTGEEKDPVALRYFTSLEKDQPEMVWVAPL